MKRLIFRISVLFIGVGSAGYTQTLIDLRTQVRFKDIDFTSAASTKPFRVGALPPAQCTVGEFFFNTSVTTGNLDQCLPANTWSPVSRDPLPSGIAGQILTNTGSGADWRTTGGDVTGSPEELRVAKIQGRAVSGQAPVDGNILQWNSALEHWGPASPLQLSGGEGIAVAGNTVAIEDAIVPIYYTGAGIPVLSCTAGRDVYVDTSVGDAYFCKSDNQWQLLSKNGHAHAWSDIHDSPLGVAKGGTGSDLSVKGPGFLRQTTTGGPLVSTLIGAADLPSSVAKTTDFYADPEWIASLSAGKIAGTLGIANGGTGHTTAAASFDALAPTSTKGDLLAHNGNGNVRVGTGSDGQCLTSDSTAPAGVRWVACGQGSAFSLTTPGQGIFRPLTGTFDAISNARGVGQANWVNGKWSIFQFTIPFPVRLGKLFALSNGGGAAGDVLAVAVYNDNGSGQPGNKIEGTDVSIVGNTAITYFNQTWGTQVTLAPGTYWLAFSYSSTTGQWYQDNGYGSMLGTIAAKLSMSPKRYSACSNPVTYNAASTVLPSTCAVTSGATDTPPLLVIEQ
jgi:hypothetical protein